MTETNLDVRIPALLSCEPGNPELENLKKPIHVEFFWSTFCWIFFYLQDKRVRILYKVVLYPNLIHTLMGVNSTWKLILIRHAGTCLT